MADREYYSDLGLPLYATISQIKAAFHTLALRHHPDKSGSSNTSAFRRIREAYEKLSDESFKAKYDRDYRRRRTQFDRDVGPRPTRTAAYEAEAAHDHNFPSRWAGEKFQEKKDSSCGSSVPKAASSRGNMAHELTVQMSSHPATEQRCMMRTQAWRQQAAGSDLCIFCLKMVTGGSRCPNCEALACMTCLSKIVAVEQSSPYRGYYSTAQK